MKVSTSRNWSLIAARDVVEADHLARKSRHDLQPALELPQWLLASSSTKSSSKILGFIILAIDSSGPTGVETDIISHLAGPPF